MIVPHIPGLLLLCADARATNNDLQNLASTLPAKGLREDGNLSCRQDVQAWLHKGGKCHGLRRTPIPIRKHVFDCIQPDIVQLLQTENICAHVDQRLDVFLQLVEKHRAVLGRPHVGLPASTNIVRRDDEIIFLNQIALRWRKGALPRRARYRHACEERKAKRRRRGRQGLNNNW